MKADKEKVYFECMSAEEAVLEGQCDEASVLIVDPPRKGNTVVNIALYLLTYL